MSYAAGQTILDDEYNLFATGNTAGTGDTSVASINTIWGQGTGDAGWGQSNTVAAVSAGSAITATQWTTLLARLNSIRQHQGTSINISSFSVAAGAAIEAIANLSTDITTLYTARAAAIISMTLFFPGKPTAMCYALPMPTPKFCPSIQLKLRRRRAFWLS